MTAAAVKLPPLDEQQLPQRMTVAEFLAWRGDGSGRIWELVEGVPRAQDAASDTHGTVHGNLTRIIGNHLEAKRPNCRIVVAPGVRPRLRADWNHRVPEIGVTCAPNLADVHSIPDPTLLIEVLSGSNAKDTWSNVPLYATLPSVQEILLVDSTAVGAHLLRRQPDGSWPQNPLSLGAGETISLESIGLAFALQEVYRNTHLAGAA
jgi:Uma2 family endonuclease